MEHRIGEIVTLPDGRKAEVLECFDVLRTDGKGIIYKEIKED